MWELHRASVRFGPTVALDDVSLTIEPGEIVVILGPSGCGKSTLLRALAGLQTLDTGAVLIDGEDATNRPPHRRGIGVVFQDPTLFPHRSVGENVAFGLRMDGVSPEARRATVAEMLALVGMADFADRPVTALSGGEAQRVALARSLAPAPRLLLLDEPLAALDRALHDRLAEELPHVLRATGTAALHVTHDHDEAFALADRVAVMRAGSILRTDTPLALYTDPRTEAVARFLGHTNIVADPGGTSSVIRRDAARVDPSGDLEARVVESRFRGDHHDVVVDTPLGRLEFTLLDPVTPGADIRLRVDPDRVAALEG